MQKNVEKINKAKSAAAKAEEIKMVHFSNPAWNTRAWPFSSVKRMATSLSYRMDLTWPSST